MNGQLEVDVSFSDESPEAVQAVLEEIGGTDVARQKQRGMTGIEIVVVATLAVQALANLAIRLLPLWKCGVVIDARQSRVRTQKDCALPQGTVLVLGPNGMESKLHQPSELDLKSLIGKLATSQA